MTPIRCIFALILGCIATHIKAQTSIDSLLQAIATNNLELKALTHEHDARFQELHTENTMNGPSVEYSPFYTKGYHGMASSELIVSQEFDFPTQYAQRRQQINLEGHALEGEYEARSREIVLEARLLIYDIIQQNQLIELLDERLAQGERVTTLIQKRMDAGDANILELNKARLEQMQTAQERTTQLNTRQELLTQLQLLNAGHALKVDLVSLPEVETSISSDEYETRLPEVEAAQKALNASQHNEKLATQSWLPTISVGYRRNTDEKVKLNGFLVGASFPLFSTSSRVKAARERTQSNQLRLEMAQQEAQLTQKQRYEELQRLQTLLDHSDTQLLRETLDLIQKAMKEGQISSLQYYTECEEIYNQLFNHIILHCSYVKTHASLYMR